MGGAFLDEGALPADSGVMEGLEGCRSPLPMEVAEPGTPSGT